MSSLFCCTSPFPYRPRYLDHEEKFNAFLTWAKQSHPSPADASSSLLEAPPPFAVQFVQQVNFGPVEARRYFIPSSSCSEFLEVTEQDLIQANFQKLNSYKNFKCPLHNKFFEVNLYQKDPVNRHHWRLNVARPAGDIDL